MLSTAARRGFATIDRLGDRFVRRDGWTALIYHRVGQRTDSSVDLSLDVFRRQLDYLSENAAVVALDDAIALDDADASTVVLTFDDGTSDWVDVVQPELVARSMPATFYVATDFVDRQLRWPADAQPINWAGLGELASNPLFEIGSHTHTHRVLQSASAQGAADELQRVNELLGEHLGAPARHFAYPKAIAPSAAAEVVVRRMCSTAALAGNRANPPGSDPHRLGRHALTVGDDMASFAAKVAGGRRVEGWARAQRDAWKSRR